jgi:hypothetical protein
VIDPQEIRAWTARQLRARRAYHTLQDELHHKAKPKVAAKRARDRQRYQEKKAKP